jgi:bleomycin hydrolase
MVTIHRRGWFRCGLGILGALLVAGGLALAVAADHPDPPIYKPAYKYPIFDELEKLRKAKQAERDSLQKIVDDRYKADEKKQKEERRSLRLDWSRIAKPPSPDAFRSAFHFPPVAQYATGTCWAFCSTSYFESEAARTVGRKVKLSEMWTVYWEYVEKARRFVREYGHSAFSEGSLDAGTREIYRRYGVVPEEFYPGILDSTGRHDHNPLYDEMWAYLTWVKEKKYWEEEKVLAYIREILDSHLGRPPESVFYEGRSYTPVEFRDQVLHLDPDDYIDIVSTMKEPYGTWIMYDFPDNWRRTKECLNLRLDDFCAVIKDAVRDGYTVSLGGDTSEPGIDGGEGAAVIPTWDVPHDGIDQASREMRIDNGTTGDDHGIQAIGFLRYRGRDWYLIKDSGRGTYVGTHPGYYYFDSDYIRLKMLSAMVHRDRLKGRLPSEPCPTSRAATQGGK